MSQLLSYIYYYKVPFLKDIKAIYCCLVGLKDEIANLIYYFFKFYMGPVIVFYIYFDK